MTNNSRDNMSNFAYIMLMIHSYTESYQRDCVSILDSQHSAGFKSSHHIILSNASGLFWFTTTAKVRLAVQPQSADILKPWPGSLHGARIACQTGGAGAGNPASLLFLSCLASPVPQAM